LVLGEAGGDAGGVLNARGGGGEFVGAVVEEAAEGGGVGFEMELETEGETAPGEGLVGAVGGFGEPVGVGREVEGVAVPVERSGGFGEEIPAGSGAGGGTPADGPPADFADGVLVDTGAEDVGEQLRAKADAEDGAAVGEGAGKEIFFSAKPGMGAVLVDVHRAAHDDEAVDFGEVGSGGAGEPRGGGEGVAAFAGPAGDFGRPFKGDVLEDVEAHKEERKMENGRWKKRRVKSEKSEREA